MNQKWYWVSFAGVYRSWCAHTWCAARVRMLQHFLILILACNCSSRHSFFTLPYMNVMCSKSQWYLLYTLYCVHIDLCCVTLDKFSFCSLHLYETMCILSPTTEFSFVPQNISVHRLTALVWVGCRALTFHQLPVTTELPITDKLSVPWMSTPHSVVNTKPRMERQWRSF